MILYLHGFRSSPESYKSRLMAAELARRGLAARWCCPQLPASPAAALRLALDLAAARGYVPASARAGTGAAGNLPPGPVGAVGADILSPGQVGATGADSLSPGEVEATTGADILLPPAPPLVVIGSSLGGFYATWLAERLGCRAVLLNPVVRAARDLATQVGSHRTFHGDEPFEFLPVHVDELARAEADIPALTQPDRYFLLAATGDEVLDWREMQARFAGARQRIIQGSDHGIADFDAYLPEVLDFVLAGSSRRPSGAPDAPDAAANRLVLGDWALLGDQASTVRLEVFVQEQHVPPEEEMDAMDAECLHALVFDAAGIPLGTGRLLPDGHIGRMAVRQPGRGKGVGSRLLMALVRAARERGDTQVVLAAQLHARPFYARHGFVEEGDTFMDAGIPHRLMRLVF